MGRLDRLMRYHRKKINRIHSLKVLDQVQARSLNGEIYLVEVMESMKTLIVKTHHLRRLSMIN
jgi:hypothetical protein